MRNQISTLTSILIIFSHSFNTFSQVSQTEKIKLFEEYIIKIADLGEFNGNVLIAEKGEIIYQNSIGLRSPKTGDLLNLDSQFNLASASNQFIDMAIMRLKEAGKLDYEDLVEKYIPEWPYKGATIKHLLNGISGYPSYLFYTQKYWKPDLSWSDPNRKINTEQMIQIFIDHHPIIEFQPGEKNESYGLEAVLLSVIIERISKMPYHQFMREQVFLPAGMDNTYIFNPERENVLTNRAFGMMPALDGSGPTIVDYHFLLYINGGSCPFSTLGDLLKWDRALYNNELVSATTLKDAYIPDTLNNGKQLPFAFGGYLSKTTNGGKRLSYSGYGVGFGIEIVREIENEILIVLLTNNNLYLGGIVKELININQGQLYKLPNKKESIGKVFTQTLLTKGIIKAQEEFLRLKQNNYEDYNFKINELLKYGSMLFRNGYINNALDMFEFIAKENPKQAARVWTKLGITYIMHGDAENALINFKKALEITPSLPIANYFLDKINKANMID